MPTITSSGYIPTQTSTAGTGNVRFIRLRGYITFFGTMTLSPQNCQLPTLHLSKVQPLKQRGTAVLSAIHRLPEMGRRRLIKTFWEVQESIVVVSISREQKSRALFVQNKIDATKK